MLRARFITPLLAVSAALRCVAAVDISKLPPPSTQPVDFARDVQPIFEKHCAKCHGAEKQKGGFRLDRKSDALRGGDNYAPAIIAGKSADSPLIHFVAGLDPDMIMPEKADPLTREQVSILRAWIDQGAPWPEVAVTKETHWSFKPIARPAMPSVSGHDFANPIDAFIAAKLGEKQLSLSPAAEPRTLCRRICFDLIGLPPTPAQVDAFVAKASADRQGAVVALVKELLASRHYGERWGRHWLDVVRFAETNGFEMNQPRKNAWRYRDWVIGAFNSDLPYDRFVVAQLAGDSTGADEATGFIVGGPWDQVKSPDAVLTANQRADELHDMVSTTGSAFLGLTVGCARCHNHKFDPIPQVDYYALKAIFAGVKHGERPLKNAAQPESEKREAELRAQLEPITRALWDFEPQARVNVSSDPQRAAIVRGRNVDRFEPVRAKFVRFTVSATTQLEPCIDELEVFTVEPQPRNVALAGAGAKATASGVFANSQNPFHKLEHINDGLYGNERSWISSERGKGWVQIEFAEPALIDRVVWSRDRDNVPRYNDRLATAYRIEVSLDGAQWQLVATADDRVPQGSKTTVAAYSAGGDAKREGELKSLLARKEKLDAELAALSEKPMVYAGKMGVPEATFRFQRGDPMQPREPVQPGAIAALPVKFSLEQPSNEPSRRLALAQWIASPSNPLTARVMVNRIWQQHFGEGLVSTPSDFGANGARPTHPELLDWLAAEFVAHGWSVKHIQELIVTSQTFQQSSLARPEGLAADAGSRLLWRFPARRLEAEPIRDAVLAVSGKLDLTAGGPGFSCFEPNESYVRVYEPKKTFAPGDWRRMVYMTKVRMQQDATFGVFDCPDGGQIAPRRSRSTTPLQALNLLNSPFILEQAGYFAERLQREAGGDRAAQVALAFRLAFGREPSAAEGAAAQGLIAEQGLTLFCRAMLNANEFVYVF